MKRTDLLKYLKILDSELKILKELKILLDSENNFLGSSK